MREQGPCIDDLFAAAVQVGQALARAHSVRRSSSATRGWSTCLQATCCAQRPPVTAR